MNGEPIWVWHTVGLPDAEHVSLVRDHRRLVIIYVKVVRRRERVMTLGNPVYRLLRYIQYLYKGTKGRVKTTSQYSRRISGKKRREEDRNAS
jgi:hypothetical protein